MAEHGVIGCYYNYETTGQSDIGKGEPRTTIQMTCPYLPVTYLGWNSSSHIWQDDIDNTNDGYPEFGIGSFKPEPNPKTNGNQMMFVDLGTPSNPKTNGNQMMFTDRLTLPLPKTNGNLAVLGEWITLPLPKTNGNLAILGEWLPVDPPVITHNVIDNTIEMI